MSGLIIGTACPAHQRLTSLEQDSVLGAAHSPDRTNEVRTVCLISRFCTNTRNQEKDILPQSLHRHVLEEGRVYDGLTIPGRACLTSDEAGDQAVKAEAIERSVRELLQLVVIDLASDENAQEIFETLNARGAQLPAADLIKSFIFRKLLDSGANVELA